MKSKTPPRMRKGNKKPKPQAKKKPVRKKVQRAGTGHSKPKDEEGVSELEIQKSLRKELNGNSVEYGGLTFLGDDGFPEDPGDDDDDF